MLSPSMMTRSNANVAWTRVISAAMSYCGLSPVPLSPKAANLTDPGADGRTTSCADTPGHAEITSRNEVNSVRRAQSPNNNLVVQHDVAETAMDGQGGAVVVFDEA